MTVEIKVFASDTAAHGSRDPEAGTTSPAVGVAVADSPGDHVTILGTLDWRRCLDGKQPRILLPAKSTPDMETRRGQGEVQRSGAPRVVGPTPTHHGARSRRRRRRRRGRVRRASGARQAGLAPRTPLPVTPEPARLRRRGSPESGTRRRTLTQLPKSLRPHPWLGSRPLRRLGERFPQFGEIACRESLRISPIPGPSHTADEAGSLCPPWKHANSA